jgi:hypothetical protein
MEVRTKVNSSQGILRLLPLPRGSKGKNLLGRLEIQMKDCYCDLLPTMKIDE